MQKGTAKRKKVPFIAAIAAALKVGEGAEGRFEVCGLWEHRIFEDFGVGHRAVLASDTADGSVEIFKELFYSLMLM